MRRVTPLVLTLAVLAVALPAWGAEKPEEFRLAGSCEAGQGSLESLLPPEPDEAGFCNTTGFPRCDTFDGTPCGPYNPQYQRCVAPAGVCEWGACTCNGSYYTCVW